MTTLTWNRYAINIYAGKCNAIQDKVHQKSTTRKGTYETYVHQRLSGSSLHTAKALLPSYRVALSLVLNQGIYLTL